MLDRKLRWKASYSPLAASCHTQGRALDEFKRCRLGYALGCPECDICGTCCMGHEPCCSQAVHAGEEVGHICLPNGL